MKAIAILNLIKNNDIKISGILKEDIFKAIKELEDLKNRSCDTCKYGHPYSGKYIECSNTRTETEGLAFKENFYCKNWESK